MHPLRRVQRSHGSTLATVHPLSALAGKRGPRTCRQGGAGGSWPPGNSVGVRFPCVFSLNWPAHAMGPPERTVLPNGDGNTTLGRPTHPFFPCWEGCGRHLLPASSFPAALPTGARVCSGHLLPLRAERVDSQTTQNQESRGLIQTIAGQVHLGTGDPCRFHATASWVCLLRSTIKLLSSSSSSSPGETIRHLTVPGGKHLGACFLY